MPSTKPLHCGIIGAGIAGLTAAIALRKAGHDVEVYERSSLKHEIGAAITLTPNGNLVLDRLGFDAAKAKETDKCQVRTLAWDTLETKYQDSFDGVKERYGGHAFNAFHRVDLHNGLREMAEEHGATIKLASDVVDIDCEAGTLTLKDGTAIQKDLVVVADGIKSPFVRAITASDISSSKTGRSIFRTLIPISRIMSDPTSAALFANNQPSGFASSTISPSGVLFVSYPCRSDTLMNIAIFHTTRPHQAEADAWNSPATVEEALEAIDGFHPAWRAMLAKADEMKVYTIGHRPLIPRLVRGKAVLIGDAAHPMMPTHAQGGCLSIEDAAALGILMSDLGQGGSVEGRLELFQAVRLPRCATTQLLSNAMFYYNGMDREALVREYYQGPLPPPNSIPWCEELRDFFYGYDVFDEVQKALRYKDRPEGVPDGVLKYFG